MAEADSSESEQCRAKTGDGERCGRPAGDDGFCYQHGPDDETVDGVEGAEASADGGQTEDDGSKSVGIREVRTSVEEVAPDLIGHPFDGVIEIEREDDGWYAVVEVVERSAVPDTQDILGRYAVELDGDANVQSYRLVERFKRGDVSNAIE